MTSQEQHEQKRKFLKDVSLLIQVIVFGLIFVMFFGIINELGIEQQRRLAFANLDPFTPKAVLNYSTTVGSYQP